jgi:phosphoglycolate phosphatase-like HAD superfamily hydrolase
VSFAVLLLDVDGTLVSAGGAGRRAITRALEEACGPADGALAALALDGKTDRLIVREGFALLRREFDEKRCDEVLTRYLDHLDAELAARPPLAAGSGYAVLPGVEALLGLLAGRRVAFGLCTGNLEGGARRKLARGGLDRFFEWGPGAIGGFAHDGEERERIVAAAVRRASARLARDVSPRECLVVGDTPRDVEAARRVGCSSLAVATGHYGVEALVASGADRVVPTLEHSEALEWLVGTGRPRTAP